MYSTAATIWARNSTRVTRLFLFGSIKVLSLSASCIYYTYTIWPYSTEIAFTFVPNFFFLAFFLRIAPFSPFFSWLPFFFFCCCCCCCCASFVSTRQSLGRAYCSRTSKRKKQSANVQHLRRFNPLWFSAFFKKK